MANRSHWKRVVGMAGTRVILVVPTWGQRCGVAEYARGLAEALRGRCDVLVARSPAEAVATAVSGRPCVVHFQYHYVLYDIRELTAALQALRKLAGCARVATLHEFNPGLPRPNTVIIENFQAIVVHSALTSRMLTAVGADPRRVSTIPIGCPPPAPPVREETRASLAIGPSPAVGYSGFALPHKGIVELAEAVQAVRRSYPGLRCFMFAPNAPYESSRLFLRTIAGEFNRRGLWDGVILRSEFVEEHQLVSLLAAMDINVLPYKSRHFCGSSSSFAVMMSAGRPTIVTDVPAFSGVTSEALKIPDSSCESISRAITTLLADPDLRERLSVAASRYAVSNSRERSASLHITIYERALASCLREDEPLPSGVGLSGRKTL